MCTKRALLVGSPYGDLKGTANDVRLMAQVLKPRGFTIVERLGDKAGRESILASWDQLIQDISSEDDAVVVYYSGHGGLVEVNVSHDQPGRTDGSNPPQRHQFIVPSDYDNTETGEFNGILTEELTDLLRKTTDKTKNVTLILDCCHSGRMARDPQSYKYAKPKFLSKVSHAKLTKHLHRMLGNKIIERRENTIRANPDAVRIVAAATSETAWEYMDERGNIVGALTKSLAAAIWEDSARADKWATASWNMAMRRVRELVTSEFCSQHPQVEGPSLRGMFSTEVCNENTFLVKQEHGGPIIQAGRVAGVKENNVYQIRGRNGDITTATIQSTTAFKSLVSLNPHRVIEYGGELAFLYTEARHRWPISCPSGSEKLGNINKKSKFLRFLAEGSTESSFAEIAINERQVRVFDSRGIQIFCKPVEKDSDETEIINDSIQAAEKLARAKHLLTLQGGTGKEGLDAALHITFQRGGFSVPEANPPAIEGEVIEAIEEQQWCINMHNKGEHTIYVTLFNVNVAGHIELLSADYSDGIPLLKGDKETLGLNMWGEYVGLPITWPAGVSRNESVPEALVFIVSDCPVNLSHLSSRPDGPEAVRKGHEAALNDGLDSSTLLQSDSSPSILELFVQDLADGRSRTFTAPRGFRLVRYDVCHRWFTLHPLRGHSDNADREHIGLEEEDALQETAGPAGLPSTRPGW